MQMKNVTFEHVKGIDEAKNELQDVVEFLRNPQKFTVLGGKLPKGEVWASTHKAWCPLESTVRSDNTGWMI